MPEIKHNFTTGKMNKDLDAKLVQNGEYRDAMNIQVSSSDDSDVGSVQNLLGNKLVDNLSYLNNSCKCVGGIADEKNDTIYWFVNQPVTDISLVNGDFASSTVTSFTTTDWGNLGEAGIVTSSEWTLVNDNDPGQTGATGHGMTVAGRLWRQDNNSYNSSARQLVSIEQGVEYTISYDRKWTAGTGKTNVYIDPYTDGSGGNSQPFAVLDETSGDTKTVTDTFVAGYTGEMPLRIFFIGNMEGEIDNVSITAGATISRILKYDKVADTIDPVFVDLDNTVLKFGTNIITGINIIDDLLFWTDNTSEPKKINIDTCLGGTANPLSNTLITRPDGVDTRMLEEHITVIKKSPLLPPTINYNYFRDPAFTHTGVIQASDTGSNPHSFLNSSQGPIHDFSLLQIGDTVDVIIESDLNNNNDFTLSWATGTDVVIKEYDDSGNHPEIPLQNYTLKGFIQDWEFNEFSNEVLDLLPAPRMIVQSKWSGHGNSFTNHSGQTAYYQYEYDATQGQYSKLAFKTVHSGSGEVVSKDFHYKISFKLRKNAANDDLQGALKVRIFTNETDFLGNGSDHPGFIELDFIDDITNSEDNKVYEYEYHPQNSNFGGETYSVDYTGPAYINSLWFEGREDNQSTPAVFNGRIKDVVFERQDTVTAKTRIEITSINPTGSLGITNPGDTSLNYAIDLFENQEGIFESKLVRFATRYKYLDNEYSHFSPFTNVVFSPGQFRYHSIEAYNTGMTNTVKNVIISNLDHDLPEDVKSIDILFKSEDSTSVYLVDTLKTADQQFTYDLTTESIQGLLPDSQFLRIYDNVPRYAKSQEIVGNRLIYGNYIENYDLKLDGGADFNIDIKTEMSSVKNISNAGLPSIKSEREYQLGVVYTDEYGRETPVLTNSNATHNLEMLNAPQVNQLSVQIRTLGHPVNMKYFKFYVKDTGGEYYNMPMDRWYDAEDGNRWLAFPSTDRNKIDLEDYIILKKGIDNNAITLTEKNKYKVIDIKNEAPEFIKREDALISKKRHNNTTSVLFEDIPVEGISEFSVSYSRYNNGPLADIIDQFNNKPVDVFYHICLSDNNNNVSKRYKIFNMSLNDNEDEIMFSIEGKFKSDISYFLDDPGNTGNNTHVLDNVSFNIFTSSVINNPRFDGRFFVKIYRDDYFQQFVETEHNTSTEYSIDPALSKKIYYCEGATGASLNVPKFHGANDMGDWWGSQHGTREYSDFDTVGSFELGVSATNPIATSTQRGTLAQWASSLSSILSSLGDFDYSTAAQSGYNDPDYTGKNTWNAMAWRGWFRGINTDARPAVSKDYRVKELDLEVDRDNNKFEDVWYINNTFNTMNYPYYSGWEVSKDYPTKNSSNGLTTFSGTPSAAWGSSKSGWEGWSSTDSSHLNLAFGGLEPHHDDDWPSNFSQSQYNSGYTMSDFFDIENHKIYSDDHGKFVKKLAAGSRFRFRQDPTETVYTIEDVEYSYMIIYDNLEEHSDWDGTSTYNSPNNNNKNQFWGNINVYTGYKNGNQFYNNEYIDNGGANTTPTRNGNPSSPGDPADTDFSYNVPSFLNASNFAINYKLKLNKNIVWNPVETPLSPINGGTAITLAAANAAPVGSSNTGTFQIETNTITGTDATSGNDKAIEVGMVLESYDDASNSSATQTLGKLAIISDISYDDTTQKFTIKFRSYLGENKGLDSANSAGNIPNIVAGDALNFKQYCMNGMNPNSAKNLNWFWEGGESQINSGVMPLGYDIEFLEYATTESDENLVSTNPAVWETEPKEDKDLDIYYEASGSYPILDVGDDLSQLIPVGSTIEHLNSNAFPPGTTVTSVTGNLIEVSNDIQVVRQSIPGHQAERDLTREPQ